MHPLRGYPAREVRYGDVSPRPYDVRDPPRRDELAQLVAEPLARVHDCLPAPDALRLREGVEVAPVGDLRAGECRHERVGGGDEERAAEVRAARAAPAERLVEPPRDDVAVEVWVEDQPTAGAEV